VIATPAAHTPLTTTFTVCLSFPVIFSPFIIPARHTIAVPCWSSCITGISNSFFNTSSISKHLGAEISSRFIPQKDGAIFLIVCIIS
jgi:hypothetical protein